MYYQCMSSPALTLANLILLKEQCRQCYKKKKSHPSTRCPWARIWCHDISIKSKDYSLRRSINGRRGGLSFSNRRYIQGNRSSLRSHNESLGYPGRLLNNVIQCNELTVRACAKTATEVNVAGCVRSLLYEHVKWIITSP